MASHRNVANTKTPRREAVTKPSHHRGELSRSLNVIVSEGEPNNPHKHVTLSEGVRDRVEGSPEETKWSFARDAIPDLWGRCHQRDGSGCQARDIVRGTQCRSQVPGPRHLEALSRIENSSSRDRIGGSGATATAIRPTNCCRLLHPGGGIAGLEVIDKDLGIDEDHETPRHRSSPRL